MKIKDFVSEHMVTHLLDLCKQELGIREMPPVNLISDQPAVGEGTSFGEFDGTGIKVITAGRHPMDVMRTLAHEVVHWKQNMQGQEMDGSDGSDVENEANATAGVIMRKFGKMYPEYFLKSMP